MGNYDSVGVFVCTSKLLSIIRPKYPNTGRKADNQVNNPDLGHTNKSFPADRACTGRIRYERTLGR